MGYKRLTQQQIDEIRELSQAKFSNKDISIGLGIAQHTVAKYVGIKHKRSNITEDVIKQMQSLRDKGLSNSQIGLELGVSKTTVDNHIGQQKSMNRAVYGSLVSYATGDSFVKESKMSAGKLKQTKTSVSWDGKEYSYKASTDGQIRITSPTGIATSFTREQFLTFVAEINEVLTWVEENSKKESVMLYHQ